jgi:O-antigen/teichoic acid export membrane protein
MLRVLELSWLTVSLLGAGFAAYKWIHEGLYSALFVLFFTAIAFMFYLIRRKQRIQQDKIRKNENR